MRKTYLPWPRSPSWQQPAALRLVERRHTSSHPTGNTTADGGAAAAAASTPYGGVTYVDPGKNPPPTPTRTACRRSRWTSTPPRTRSPSATSTTATSPTRPASGSRSGSTPSTRAIRPPRTGPSPSRSTAPRPRSPTRTDVLLRIGIKARESTEQTRPNAALTFVIDTSGSMGTGTVSSWSRIHCANWSTASASGDSIAVVTFGDDARVVLPPTRATDEKTILAAIDALQPGGSTNLEAGLRLGYRLAREAHLGDGGIDRVILASDGVANVGLTDATGDPRPDPPTTPRPASSSSRSGSGWATTTTPCSSSWPTRATGSTPTSTTWPRPAGCSPRTWPGRSSRSPSTPRSRSLSIPRRSPRIG